MSDIDDDVLAILDDPGPGTTVLLSESEGYGGLDDVEMLTIVVAKSDGDGTIVKLEFQDGEVRFGASVYEAGNLTQAYGERR